MRSPKFRYIPKDSEAVEHRLGVVYKYQCGSHPAAVAYAGKANKASFHNTYVGRDPEKMREEAIASFFKGLEASEKMKLDRREEAKKPHAIAVGAIVYNSWGYDQTNVDFYEVVKVSANYVWLQSLESSAPEDGFMSSSRTLPRKGTAHGEVTKRRVSGSSINFKYGGGSVWDGRPMTSSWCA
jgi:hypothetical protein